MLCYTAATRIPPAGVTPAQLLLLCKRLPALCSLDLNSSSISAHDVLAIAELTALTLLHLAVEQS
jgi:hypothetical protein